MGSLITLLSGQTSPADIKNLKIWFDAADSTSFTFNGSNVSQWSDKSGKANHATQGTASNQPKYVTNGINGLAAVEGRWDGVNTSQLVITDNANLDYSNFSAFLVAMRVTDLGASESLLGKYVVTGSQKEHLLQIDANDRLVLTTSADGNVTFNATVTSPTVSVSAPLIVDISFAASAAKITINNGTPVTSSSLASIFNGSANYTLFSRPALSDPFAGRIGEYCFYDRVISADERLRVLNYLAQKWRITIS